MTELRVVRAAEQPFTEVRGDGAEGLELARIDRHPDGGATFQIARIAPGGVSKRHAHAWDQANWIASGEAKVDVDGQTFHLRPGDSVIIPGGTPHSFANRGERPLTLLAVLGPGAP
jgi:quercetin dioxygenase-like cupin family protein